MGFFSKILDKLGFDAGAGKVEEMLRTPIPPKAPDTTSMGAGLAPGGAAAEPITQVDVVAQLNQKAAANSQKLNWQTSIVDLMKMLDIDSSLERRKELAKALGAPAALMHAPAQISM